MPEWTDEYEEEQKRLWNEMINRNTNGCSPVSVLTNKQKYGTNMLSIEASKYLLLQIVGMILA